MAYQIVTKKRFTNKLVTVLHYLEREWSKKVADNFLKKTEQRLQLHSSNPYMGAPSRKIPTVRGILITRHNKMYYKISNDKVVILTMYDTRIDPRKNPYK